MYENLPRRLRDHVRFLSWLFRLNLASAMEYRASFVSQMVFMFLNNLLLLVFWAVFFRHFPGLRGWTMDDVLLLYAVVCVSYGLVAVLWGHAFDVSSVITSGRLDQFLAQPKDALVHLLGSRMRVSGWGDLAFGLMLLPMTGRASLEAMAVLLPVAALSALVFASFMVTVHCLTFVVGSAESVGALMVNAITTLSLYPSSIYSGTVRFLTYTVVPAGLMAHLPAAIVREPSLGKLALLTTVALGMAALARVVFYRGLRRYESGNLFQERM